MFGNGAGSQVGYFFCEVGDHPGKLLGFGRGVPFQVKASPKAHEFKHFLDKGDAFDGHVITVQVMAVADVSATDQNSIGTFLKSFESMVR